MAKSFGFEGNTGVLVEETFPNTPATGKLQKGDIITELDGKAVDDVQELRNTVAVTPPGTDVKFKVWRNNKSVEVTVKIGEQPDNLMAMAGRNRPDEQSPRTRRPKKLPKHGYASGYSRPGHGPEVRLGRYRERHGRHPCRPAPVAYKAGLREGDLITQVGGRNSSLPRRRRPPSPSRAPTIACRSPTPPGHASF